MLNQLAHIQPAPLPTNYYKDRPGKQHDHRVHAVYYETWSNENAVKSHLRQQRDRTDRQTLLDRIADAQVMLQQTRYAESLAANYDNLWNRWPYDSTLSNWQGMEQWGIVFDCAQDSAYQTSILDRANFDTFVKIIADHTAEYELEYKHQTQYLVARVLDDNGDPLPIVNVIEDTLKALENYPVLDEMLWSEREMEALDEALESYWLKSDLERATTLEDLPDDYLDMLHTADSRSNGALFIVFDNGDVRVDYDQLEKLIPQWFIQEDDHAT